MVRIAGWSLLYWTMVPLELVTKFNFYKLYIDSAHYASPRSPQMNFGGYQNWPPIWVTGAASKNYQTLSGEIGILTAVLLNDVAPDKLFLKMKLQSERYMGCLAFTDPVFCRQLYLFLQGHTGKSIKEIGDLDLSHTL
jgi:hypothetical protein